MLVKYALLLFPSPTTTDWHCKLHILIRANPFCNLSCTNSQLQPPAWWKGQFYSCDAAIWQDCYHLGRETIDLQDKICVLASMRLWHRVIQCSYSCGHADWTGGCVLKTDSICHLNVFTWTLEMQMTMLSSLNQLIEHVASWLGNYS